MRKGRSRNDPERNNARSEFGRPVRPTRATLAVAATVCVVLSACGSTSSSSTNAKSGAAVANTTKFTGAPIIISTSAGVDTPLGSFPQIFAGVQGAARAINARGGIDGHELVVHTCNTNSTPSGEVACAQQAVSNGSVAMVGDFVYADAAAFVQTLQKAGIADVANYWSPNQQTLNNTFTLQNALGDESACLDPAFTKSIGATKAVGLVHSLAGGEAEDALNRQIAAGLHNPIPFAASIGFSDSTTDFTPIVQRVSDSGANLLVLNASAPTSTALLTTALPLGKKWSYCGDFGSITGKEALGLGSGAQGLYQVNFTPPPTAAAQYPMLREFIADMKAEESTGDSAASIDPANYNEGMLEGWLGVQTLAQAAQKLSGPVTRASLLSAMRTLHPNLGNLISVNFATPVGTGAYQRIYNPWIVIWHWDPSKKNWYLVPGVRTNSVAALGAAAR